MKKELARRTRMKLSTVVCASALALGPGFLGGPAYAQDVTAEGFHATLESYRSRMQDAIWAIESVNTAGPFCSNAEKQKAYGELLPWGRRTEELAADFNTWRSDVLRSMNYAYIAKQYYEADVHPEDRRTWADVRATESRMLDLYERRREELRRAKVIDCTQEETQTAETTTAGGDPAPEPGPDLPAPPAPLNLASSPTLPDHFCSELERITFVVERVNPLMIDADDQGMAWMEYAQQLEKIAQTLDGANRNEVLSKARQARSIEDRADAAARRLDKLRSTVYQTPVIDCGTKDAEDHVGRSGVESAGGPDLSTKDLIRAGFEAGTNVGEGRFGLFEVKLEGPEEAVAGQPFTVTATVSRRSHTGTYRVRYGGEAYHRGGMLDPSSVEFVGPENEVDRPPPDWATPDGEPPDPPEFTRDIRIEDTYWLLEGRMTPSLNLSPAASLNYDAPEELRVDESSYTFRQQYTCEEAGKPYLVRYRSGITYWYTYIDTEVFRWEPSRSERSSIEEGRTWPETKILGRCVAVPNDEQEITAGEQEPADGEESMIWAETGLIDAEPAAGEPADTTDATPQQESDTEGGEPSDDAAEEASSGGEALPPESDGDEVSIDPGAARALPIPGTSYMDPPNLLASAWTDAGRRADSVQAGITGGLEFTVEPADTGLPWRESAAPPSSAPASLEAYLVGTGRATGDAFRLHVINRGDAPVDLRLEGLVLEPLELDDQAQAALEQRLRELEAEGGVTVAVQGFCLEMDARPPAAGQLVRLAAPDVRSRFPAAGRILQAADQLSAAGGLRPDSDPAAYTDAIKQWSIWAAQNDFDIGTFAEAFVARTRETFEAADREWTPETERAVLDLAPNRWSDIRSILHAANAWP